MRYLRTCGDVVAISAPALAEACNRLLHGSGYDAKIRQRVGDVLAKASLRGFGETPGPYRLLGFGFNEVVRYPDIGSAFLQIPEQLRPGITFAQIVTSAAVNGCRLTLMDSHQHRVALTVLGMRGLALDHEFF